MPRTRRAGTLARASPARCSEARGSAAWRAPIPPTCRSPRRVACGLPVMNALALTTRSSSCWIASFSVEAISAEARWNASRPWSASERATARAPSTDASAPASTSSAVDRSPHALAARAQLLAGRVRAGERACPGASSTARRFGWGDCRWGGGLRLRTRDSAFTDGMTRCGPLRDRTRESVFCRSFTSSGRMFVSACVQSGHGLSEDPCTLRASVWKRPATNTSGRSSMIRPPRAAAHPREERAFKTTVESGAMVIAGDADDRRGCRRLRKQQQPQHRRRRRPPRSPRLNFSPRPTPSAERPTRC